MIALVNLQMQVKWNIPDDIIDKILEIRRLDEFANEEEVVIHAINELSGENVVNVEKTPGAFNPVVFPNIFNPLAVTTPTESTLVTSS